MININDLVYEVTGFNQSSKYHVWIMVKRRPSLLLRVKYLFRKEKMALKCLCYEYDALQHVLEDTRNSVLYKDEKHVILHSQHPNIRCILIIPTPLFAKIKSHVDAMVVQSLTN